MQSDTVYFPPKSYLTKDGSTLSKRKTAHEVRLLSYCLKTALQAESPTESEDRNDKKSECFDYISSCFMGGTLARQKIAHGVRAYKMQDYKTAYREWQAAARLCDNRELFYTLNYLISICFDFGNFQRMLGFAMQQFQIGRLLNDRSLLAAAYLNLATSRGLLGNWELCLSYCRICLVHLESTKIGYVYMSVAFAYLELNRFESALAFLKETFDLCSRQKNYGLLVQCLMACSGMFLMLKSYPQAREFALRAVEMAKRVFSSGPGNARFRRTMVHLIPVQIKLRQLDDALELCQDAVRDSLEYHDRYVQAKCMLYFAEIHRHKSDYEVAYQSYQAAADSNYPYIQLKAFLGLSKSAMDQHDRTKISKTKALEFCAKALDLAELVGSKVELIRIHRRMSKLNAMAPAEPDKVAQHTAIWEQLLSQLKLICHLCGDQYGLQRTQLKALTCGHIFHARCLNGSGTTTSGKRHCVVCRCASDEVCETFLFTT